MFALSTDSFFLQLTQEITDEKVPIFRSKWLKNRDQAFFTTCRRYLICLWSWRQKQMGSTGHLNLKGKKNPGTSSPRCASMPLCLYWHFLRSNSRCLVTNCYILNVICLYKHFAGVLTKWKKSVFQVHSPDSHQWWALNGLTLWRVEPLSRFCIFAPKETFHPGIIFIDTEWSKDNCKIESVLVISGCLFPFKKSPCHHSNSNIDASPSITIRNIVKVELDLWSCQNQG